MSKFQKQGKDIILCCNGKGGCPTLRKLSNDNIRIKDDYGNIIIITTEEARLIHEALKEL